MPWETDKFKQKVDHLKDKIEHVFNIWPEIPVFLCSQQELRRELKKELQKKSLPSNILKFHLEYTVNDVIGKYFKEQNEIWLLDEFHDHEYLIIHELLHSIQKCQPHREGIVDFISYILSKDPRAIDPNLLEEWKGIEKNYGKKTIVKHLLLEKDCEDFS